MNESTWAPKYDKAAQDFLGADEQVLAAVQVARGGGWTALGLAQVSGLGAMAAMMRGKKRAGGLPQQFLLAVTDERVYALALPKMSSGLKPRAVKELARWERADVRVTGRGMAIGTEIVIESPAEGERAECQGPGGELSDRFVRAAAAPAAVAA
jgi:hypothetical protein